MGDTDTHALIDGKLIDIGKANMPAPDSTQAGFIELGNWMTNYSQFHHPTIFISGKVAVWNQARATAAGHIIGSMIGTP